MKALISAFALLAFVAASTVPYVAANAQTTQTTPTKKKAAKKHVKKAATHKKTSKKAKKPTQPAA